MASLREGKVPQAEVEGASWQALAEARPWAGLDYRVRCRLVPQIGAEVFDCFMAFSNGASIHMDVIPGERLVRLSPDGAVNQPR